LECINRVDAKNDGVVFPQGKYRKLQERKKISLKPLISQNRKAISSLNIVNAIRALKAISSLNINMVNVIQKKTGSSENKKHTFRKPTNSAKAKKE